MSMSPGQVPTALAALAIVVGLIWLSARLARSSGLSRAPSRPGSAHRLVVEDTIRLDRQRCLHVVRCDGQGLILLTGGAADVVLQLAAPPGKELVG